MQQFRPLPRFDVSKEAEPLEMPLAPTTDPRHAHTDPLPFVTNQRFMTTDPRLATTNQQYTGTNPRLETHQPQESSKHTSARLPIVLLGSPSSPSNTDRLAGFVGKPLTTDKHASLSTVLQATMGSGATSATSRLIVIPGARGRKKTTKPPRRLNPRLRQGVVFLATLIIVFCTLTTLVPLSDDRSSGNIFSNINGWLRSAQLDWNIQAHQGNDNVPTALNGPGLPYMTIANSPYIAVAEQAARDAGISPVYFVRQIQQESGFNANAVSVTNAEGIAQFEPSTASNLGIDPWNPTQSLRGAAHLMANYFHQYGNYAKALGAYNAGPGAVQSAVYSCGMYWLSCMPGQSQDYVYRIMGV